MHTPAVCLFDNPPPPGGLVARERMRPERARTETVSPVRSAVAEPPVSVERLAEKNANRLAWAVATALGFAVVIGSVVGFIASVIGMMIVPEFRHGLSVATLASVVMIAAGSALVGGLIGARAAFDNDDPHANASPAIDSVAQISTDTESGRFAFSNGTSPPRYNHELI